jgi:hypothetical protein
MTLRLQCDVQGGPRLVNEAPMQRCCARLAVVQVSPAGAQLQIAGLKRM